MAPPSLLLRWLDVGPPAGSLADWLVFPPLVKVISLGTRAPQVSNTGHMVPPGGSSPRANTIIDGDDDSNMQEKV
jgi:hypothetical protein